MSFTKQKSFREITDDGTRSKRRRQVYTLIAEHPHCSRADIAKLGNIRLSCVCGRVNELIEAGRVVEVGTKVDSETHKTVALLDLAAGVK